MAVAARDSSRERGAQRVVEEREVGGGHVERRLEDIV